MMRRSPSLANLAKHSFPSSFSLVKCPPKVRQEMAKVRHGEPLAYHNIYIIILYT